MLQYLLNFNTSNQTALSFLLASKMLEAEANNLVVELRKLASKKIN
jgi:hypothetical protein